MRKISDFALYIILAVGLLFLVGGFLICVYAVESDLDFVYQIWPLISLLAGVIVIFYTMAFSHKTYMLFIGTELSFCSCYALILERGTASFGFVEGWPLFAVLTGVALIFSCLYKHKKLSPNYFVPAVVMIVLGVFFLLFSLDVIKMPISRFFAMVGPFIMIGLGAAIIVFFFLQISHRELVIKEESADNEE